MIKLPKHWISTGLLLITFLFVPVASATYTYERTPNGSNPALPITFELTWDNLETDFEVPPEEVANINYWGLSAESLTWSGMLGCYPIATQSAQFILDDEDAIGSEITSVYGIVDTDENCPQMSGYHDGFEYNEGNVLFTIQAEGSGLAIETTNAVITSGLNWYTDILVPIFPLLIAWSIAIIGIWIVWWLIKKFIKR